MIRWLFILATLAFPAAAEELVASLSQNRIGITASFDGSEILVFGAVKHEQPIGTLGASSVIITVSGPSVPVTVRRKAKRAGIWINTDAVEVDAAPSFYSVSTTGPMATTLSDIEDLRHKISIPRAIRSVGAPQSISDSESFTEALIRIRTKSGLYQLLEGNTTIFDQTLFRANIALPANLVEGVYETRIFLTRDRKIVGKYTTFINVRKVGLERWIFNLAHERPLIYGFLSLFIAIAAGWSASAVFRYLRG